MGGQVQVPLERLAQELSRALAGFRPAHTISSLWPGGLRIQFSEAMTFLSASSHCPPLGRHSMESG